MHTNRFSQPGRSQISIREASYVLQKSVPQCQLFVAGLSCPDGSPALVWVGGRRRVHVAALHAFFEGDDSPASRRHLIELSRIARGEVVLPAWSKNGPPPRLGSAPLRQREVGYALAA
jgi:hypothetical protein